MQNSEKTPETMPVGLLRRLAAILYDTTLVAALLLFASALITLPVGLIFGPEASAGLSQNPLFRLWLLTIPPAFFIWFWTRGGQTLGMRSWRIKVIRNDGAPLTPRDAVLRALCALLSWIPFGLGFLWSLFDSEKLAWHDRLSHTRLVLLPKA